MKIYKTKSLVPLLLASCLGIFSISPSYALSEDDLLLCNTLDSNNAVLNSAVGPNLALYKNIGDPFAIVGAQAYESGVFGNALTLGNGPAYYSTRRAHNVTLNNASQYLSPEQGTIEVWFKQNARPVPFTRNPYRIFGGDYGHEGGIMIQSNGGGLNLEPPRLEFALLFNSYAQETDVISLTDNKIGYDISNINGKWLHIAGVWDRNGIDGSSETMQLFVDGIKVAVSVENGWGTTVGDRIDIGGGNDGDIAHAFLVDELKLWANTKTDFSDRFVGGCASNDLAIEKLINHRVSETPASAADLLVGTRYRAEYKVTNNSPDRLNSVRVFEDGELVCNMYSLAPGQSKQPYRCGSNQAVLNGLNNIPANVSAKVTGSNKTLANQTNAYYIGYDNEPGKLKVTHYVNEKNADTQASAVQVNGDQAEVKFRVENTGSIKLYRVKLYHDPASPVNSGWQELCYKGTLMPGEVRYCKTTINLTASGLNKAFGRAQGRDTNVGSGGVVNASNPTYFNVALP